jgi:ParB family chromosome partitioning protein
MTDISLMPLNKLVDSAENVRKTAGCRSSPHRSRRTNCCRVARKSKKGKFAVFAGGRRLAALRLLADAGRSRPTMPCHVLDGAADPVEISLAEISVREPMHAAAASVTETGFSPVSEAKSPRLAGPRGLAMKT